MKIIRHYKYAAVAPYMYLLIGIVSSRQGTHAFMITSSSTAAAATLDIHPHPHRQWRRRSRTTFVTGCGTTAVVAAAVTSEDCDSTEHKTPVGKNCYSVRDSFNLIVVGDLHMEDDMAIHEQSRQDCLRALERLSLLPCLEGKDGGVLGVEDDVTVAQLLAKLENARAGDLTSNELEMLLARKNEGPYMKSNIVSLGDLGRKDIRHEPGDAGTTKSFEDARNFFDGFGGIPYNLVTGNHDLEGLDEFDEDADNLQAWMDTFGLDQPGFCRQVGEKTLLVGLSTVRFRDAPFSSHEVHVDEEQLQWFLDVIESHPHEDGWKIMVFSHAPIMGSGLRVLQNVHVVNGCAWLNHCSPDTRKLFIQTVKANPQIKLWCSGHFHLSHDYQVQCV
jgi:hypothetical protein